MNAASGELRTVGHLRSRSKSIQSALWCDYYGTIVVNGRGDFGEPVTFHYVAVFR